MPRVTFKTVDETHDIRLIETRQELSQQDLNDRWYNCQETKAMTEQARVIIEFVKIQGIASNLVRIGLEMQLFDLRGLELYSSRRIPAEEKLRREKIDFTLP